MTYTYTHIVRKVPPPFSLYYGTYINSQVNIFTIVCVWDIPDNNFPGGYFSITITPVIVRYSQSRQKMKTKNIYIRIRVQRKFTLASAPRTFIFKNHWQLTESITTNSQWLLHTYIFRCAWLYIPLCDRK